MFLVMGAAGWGCLFLEDLLRGDALAGGGPHVADVEILVAVVVVVERADAHSCADVFDSSLRGDIGEGAIAVVPVGVVTAEVVDDVEVRPSVLVGVPPRAAQAVTGV